MELCLFDRPSDNEDARIRIRERTNGAWHIYLPGLGPGQLYGYRVYGPYDPHTGIASTHTSCCSTPMPRRSAGS